MLWRGALRRPIPISKPLSLPLTPPPPCPHCSSSPPSLSYTLSSPPFSPQRNYRADDHPAPVRGYYVSRLAGHRFSHLSLPSSGTETALIDSACTRYGGAGFGNRATRYGAANNLSVPPATVSTSITYHRIPGLYKAHVPAASALGIQTSISRPYSTRAPLAGIRQQPVALDTLKHQQLRALSTSQPTMYTASFAFFEAIWEAGITHCFVNLGSDHPSIIEAMVKGQREAKGNFPRIITCPNEVCS